MKGIWSLKNVDLWKNFPELAWTCYQFKQGHWVIIMHFKIFVDIFKTYILICYWLELTMLIFWSQDKFIPNIWRISFFLLLTGCFFLKIDNRYHWSCNENIHSFLFYLLLFFVVVDFLGWIKSTWIKIDMKCVELHSCDGWPFITIKYYFLFIILVSFLLNHFFIWCIAYIFIYSCIIVLFMAGRCIYLYILVTEHTASDCVDESSTFFLR